MDVFHSPTIGALGMVYSIVAFRDTRLNNMFDVNMIQQIAYKSSYYDLVC